jgi:hypothetical protein
MASRAHSGTPWIPLTPSLTGEDTSTHNRGMGGPLARLPLSVQPGEVLVQVCITTCALLLDEKCMVCAEVWCKIHKVDMLC